MRKPVNMACDSNFYSQTGNANYRADSISTNPASADYPIGNTSICSFEYDVQAGKYSVFAIANWFLAKEAMPQKKLQKLCYYAQAWFYALKDFRLEDTDFQAWVHGPVSPVLYERFKDFGYASIKIASGYQSMVRQEDLELLESVWKTYGSYTGNALEALSHQESPWIEARKGYAPQEYCKVIISPMSMQKYYRSIYDGGKA